VSGLVIKAYRTSRHEDPTRHEDCLEWLVRRGSLVFVDASNEREFNQETVFHDWRHGKEEEGSGSSTDSPDPE